MSITAVIHGDTHGLWATIDEAPTYTATADTAFALMERVNEAVALDFLGLHDDDLRWRVCGDHDGRRGVIAARVSPSVARMFGGEPMRCHGRCEVAS